MLIIERCAMIGIPKASLLSPFPLPPYRSFSQRCQMAISPSEALKQLYSGYVGALQGASDFLRDDLPSASPGLAKWAQETGRRACRKYARQRGAVPFLTSDPTWDGICGGYWDSINEGPTSEGSYGPLYPGGQCAVPYRWTTRNKIYNVNTGEISQELTSTAGDYGGPLSWSNLPDITSFGDTISRQQVTYVGGSLIYNTRIVNQYGQLFATTEIEDIRRADGQADNCGDQPDNIYNHPKFPPNLPPLDPPTNPAPGLGDNWEVNILPDGQINICIAGECSGGIPPGGGSGPDSGGGPGEPDGDPEETDPNDPNNPNEVSGCVEEGNLLTGLKITFTEIPPHQAPLGDIYYRVCWVWMGPDSDKLDMVIDGLTMQDGQFVIPDSRDCTCYKVRANAGWRLEVQPYSRPKEE